MHSIVAPKTNTAMNFDKANRHMELAGPNVPEGKSFLSLSPHGTQVPADFSSSSEEDKSEPVFINTQIQGRLDEAEEMDKIHSTLGRFRYNSQGAALSPGCRTTVQKPSGRVRKKTSSSQQKRSPTKAESLLKQLSGKHGKIQDMIKYGQKMADFQQKVKDGNKMADTKKKIKKKYDIYNANEWQRIYNLLLEKFPQTKLPEVEDTYLYGDDSKAQTLWNESQGLMKSSLQDTESLPLPLTTDDKRVSVLSLSQVMDDVSDREDIVVADTTDEEDTLIPIPSPLRRGELTFGSRGSDVDAVPQASDEVIDLTQRPFKVVKSLISPLKRETDEEVKVPATRLPTLGTTPHLTLAKDELLLCQPHSTQLESFDSADKPVVHSPGHSLEDVSIPDTESDNADSEDHHVVKLEPSILTGRTPSPRPESPWKSQSAQRLRECISSLGLKTSRSKRQMVESLQAASQVLEVNPSQSSITQENKMQNVHNYLTSLVQSSPVLLEKVYTFQPIACSELLTKLRDANPFVDAIDECTIRAWADNQGICLTTG